jgi:hypothetical protein
VVADDVTGRVLAFVYRRVQGDLSSALGAEDQVRVHFLRQSLRMLEQIRADLEGDPRRPPAELTRFVGRWSLEYAGHSDFDSSWLLLA